LTVLSFYLLAVTPILLAQSIETETWSMVKQQGPLFTFMFVLLVMLYRGTLCWGKDADARVASVVDAANKQIKLVTDNANERLADAADRYEEMKEDRNQWRADARGTNDTSGSLAKTGERLASKLLEKG
jgi:hypothetical protein